MKTNQIKTDQIKVNGSFSLQVVNKDGKITHDTGLLKNIMTSAGKAAMAGLVGNTGAVTAFNYVAVGTSTTPVAVTDTTLGSEIVDSGLARASATISRVTTTVANDTLQLLKSFSVTGTKVVQEIGVFNASSSGTILCHQLTGSLTVNNGDTLILTYKVQFT